MKFIEWIKSWFTVVYCEDCEHRFWHKDSSTIFTGTDGWHCRKSPVRVDLTEKDDFITRKKEKHTDTYLTCEEVRRIKKMPRLYRSHCSKFSLKEEKVVDK